jgi:CTP synthase
LKTKPTQHSVNELRRIGIQPDAILCRSDYEITQGIKDKLSLFCDVEPKAVIPLVTAETIYEVPLMLEDTGLGDWIADRLDLGTKLANLEEWRIMVSKLKTEREPVTVALVGKYVELTDAYFSVREALCHAGLHHDSRVDIHWVQSENLESGGNLDILKSVQGIIVPGGFGYRGIEGMVVAARYARQNRIPYLGLCLGMQVLVIEFGRFALNNEGANSIEFDPQTPCPVIDLLKEQQQVTDMGGTMRLGIYPCHLVPDTKAALAYSESIVYERHRHRYEFNNDYREAMENKGLIPSGVSPDNKLVEIVEIKDHPWMVACQFHPEFRSRPNKPHPLFTMFVGAAKETLVEGTQVTLPLT